MFNKVLLATSAAVLISGSAMAADAIVYNEPAPVAAVNTFSWEGAYIGLNAGYGFGKTKTVLDNGADGGTVKPRGFVGGAQAGYNWQFDQVVAGIEVDFQGSGMKKTFNIYNAAGAYLADKTAKVEWFGTVRARLGVDVVERTMLYGTAGFAYGKVNETDTNFKNESIRASKTRAGWTVGAGIEHAFTDNVTLKTEYLYTDLGNTKFETNPFHADKIKTNFHTVRVGVNYKF